MSIVFVLYVYCGVSGRRNVAQAVLNMALVSATIPSLSRLTLGMYRKKKNDQTKATTVTVLY